jgi:hypothetical protein
MKSPETGPPEANQAPFRTRNWPPACPFAATLPPALFRGMQGISQAIGIYPHGKTLSKADTWGEDGSASGIDMERISTPDAIVEKVRSRRRWTTAKMEIVLDLTCRTAR